MSKEVLEINKNNIEPGENSRIRLHVGRLPTGTRIFINAQVFRSENPGPTCLLIGGVHGDEINGVEIVRRSIAQGFLNDLQAGTVIAIPLLNIYGFIIFSRDVPDGKDVNRSFPGHYSGSLASRVARTVYKKILPHVDFGVDFHTGGKDRFNFPQIRYTKKHKESEQLADLFNAPVTLPKTAIAKSLRKVAVKMGVPMLVFEGGEALRLDGFAIETAIKGIKRLLHGKGMLEENPPALHQNKIFNKSTWLRAKQAGMFEWIKNSGQFAYEGEPLGYIRDPYGKSEIVVKSKKSGFIVGHNNAPLVNQGDALFNITYNANKK